MMTDRPILFSAPMVRALLDGTKTQTRRILKDHQGAIRIVRKLIRPFDGGPSYYAFERQSKFLEYAGDVKIPIAIGDQLWVREAHALVGTVDPPFVIYRASGYDQECIRHGFDQTRVPKESEIRWRPSIHMPRWASRLTLTVTDVRVQRIQDMQYIDFLQEGIESTEIWKRRQDACLARNVGCGQVCRDSFAELWDSLNADRAPWADNPWVVSYTFTVARHNIDMRPE